MTQAFNRRLFWIDEEFAMVRMAPTAPLPDLAGITWLHLSRTPHELSMVVPSHRVPPGAEQVEGGWSALMVEGPLHFALVGVLAELSGALAAASISLYAISTWDTDYLLVRSNQRAEATAALTECGWSFPTETSTD